MKEPSKTSALGGSAQGAAGEQPASESEDELVASLQPDLSWQLRDGSGKSLKALPASQDKLAAGLYKSAQKTVKELKKSLSERLFEAMCCARSWNFAAWDASLLGMR